jgi:hypothetical protein
MFPFVHFVVTFCHSISFIMQDVNELLDKVKKSKTRQNHKLGKWENDTR